MSNQLADVTIFLAMQATQLKEEVTENGGSMKEAEVLGVLASTCLGA